jgi:hypothetical protein
MKHNNDFTLDRNALLMNELSPKECPKECPQSQRLPKFSTLPTLPNQLPEDEPYFDPSSN